jgi:hypothetical protein
MKLTAIASTLLLFVSALAWAQSPVPIQSLQLKPVQQATPSDLQLQTEEAVLKRRVAQLERENAALKQQLQDYAQLGGSNVHAYCPVGNPTVSRSTAGAESNCADGGYTCEPVSGLCRTSCSTSDHCSTGFDCSSASHTCRTIAEVQAENDQG